MVVARQQHAWEHKKLPSACGTATKHPKKPTLISLPHVLWFLQDPLGAHTPEAPMGAF